MNHGQSPVTHSISLCVVPLGAALGGGLDWDAWVKGLVAEGAALCVSDDAGMGLSRPNRVFATELCTQTGEHKRRIRDASIVGHPPVFELFKRSNIQSWIRRLYCEGTEKGLLRQGANPMSTDCRWSIRCVPFCPRSRIQNAKKRRSVKSSSPMVARNDRQ